MKFKKSNKNEKREKEKITKKENKIRNL